MHQKTSTNAGTVPVKRRKVLYISGFDPRGASHYHALYRQEAEKAQHLTNQQYTVSDRKRNGRFSASWNIATETTTVDYEFLNWDDIIRQHWQKHPYQIIGKSSLAYWHFLTSGTLRKIFNISKTHFFAFIYPLIFLSLLVAITSLGMLLTAKLISNYLAGYHLELLLVPLVGYGIFTNFGEYLESRFNFYWMMRGVTFYVSLSKGKVDGFDDRIESFVEHLIKCNNDESYDELLVIGHSFGTILLPLILSSALTKKSDFAGEHDKLSIITLGHVIPDVSLLPGSESMRKAVCHSTSEGIFWLDVTAPPDGVCFPLVDITTGSRCTAAARKQPPPVRISARFHKMFTAEHYKHIRRDKHRIHFQYIMAGDHHTEYNYFDITAGDIMLQDRYSTYLSENNP